MSAVLGRAFLRQTPPVRCTARNASSMAEGVAAKAKETSNDMTSKASQGLTRVASSAGPVLSKASSAVSGALNALGKVGGRTGQVAGFLQSLGPPTIYYSRVGLELAKTVAKSRGMSVPDGATFSKFYEPLINKLQSPTELIDSISKTAAGAAKNAMNTPTSILQRIRDLDNQQIASAGIAMAEVVGFFTVGEMIGRMKIVGYRTTGHANGNGHH